MTLEELVGQLQKVYGAQLRSVVLYGSAAAGEHIPKRSDYNVLVIVDELTMEHMRAGAAVARAWGEDGNPPPLTFTLDEWQGSSDIFPMEYADILERQWQPGFGCGCGCGNKRDPGNAHRRQWHADAQRHERIGLYGR